MNKVTFLFVELLRELVLFKVAGSKYSGSLELQNDKHVSLMLQ